MAAGKQQEGLLAGGGIPAGTGVSEAAVREARVRRRLIILAKIVFIVSLALLVPAVLSYAYYAESRVLSDSIDDFAKGTMYQTTAVQVGSQEGVQLVAMGLSAEPYGWVTETVASTPGASPQPMPNNHYWSDAMAVVLPPPDSSSTIPPRIIFVGGAEYSTETGSPDYSNKVYTATIIVSNTQSTSGTVFSNSLTDWILQGSTVPLPPYADDNIAGGALVLYKKDAATSYLYLIGGYYYDDSMAGTFASGDVYSATVNNNTGGVSGWNKLPYAVPPQDPGFDEPGLQFPSAVIDEDVIYVMGGAKYPDAGFNFDCYPNAATWAYHCYSEDVYTATIIPGNGGLNLPNDTYWGMIEDALPASITNTNVSGAYYGAAVKYSGATSTTVYYIGGIYYNSSTGEEHDISRDVFFGDISPKGYLSFTKSLSGPVQGNGMYAHGAANTGEQLVTVGGADNTSSSSLSQTVQAALADEAEASTRLFDFCKDDQGNPITPCDFPSRWVANEETFLPRRLYGHSLVEWNGNYFVLGGNYWVGTTNTHSRMIYHGTVNGNGSNYPPNGYYTSEKFQPSTWSNPYPISLRRLDWEVTSSSPISSGLVMYYRSGEGSAALESASWITMPISLLAGTRTYSYTFNPPITVSVSTLFQYRGHFTSTYPYKNTARLEKVTIYYYLDNPDLKIYKTADVTKTSPGNTITFTLYYTNPSPVNVTARITDYLPSFVYINSGGNQAGWQGQLNVWSNNVYSPTTVYTYFALPGGTYNRSLQYTATVAAPLVDPYSPITNTVFITYNSVMTDKFGIVVTDPNPADNWSRWPFKLLYVGLNMAKNSSSPRQAGQLITYTITITGKGTWENNGPVEDVVITDAIPSNLRQVEVCGFNPQYGGDACTFDNTIRVVTWTFASEVEPGVPREVYFKGYIKKPTLNGTVMTNTAAANSWQLDSPVTAIHTHTVSSSPDLGVYKSAIGSYPPGSDVPRGEQIHYTLSISNTGGAPATNVVVTDTFGSDFSVITYSQPANPAWNCAIIDSNKTLRCTIGYLGLDSGDPVGWGISGTQLLDFYLLVNSGATTGTLSNRAYVRADGFSTKPSNEVTHTIVSGGLLLVKTANPPGGGYAPRGSTITYTIYYTNRLQIISNAVLTDTFSNYETFKSGSCSPSCNRVGNVLTWYLGTLDNGASGSAIFQVTVANTVPTSAVIRNNCQIGGKIGIDNMIPKDCNEVVHSVPLPNLKVSKDAEPAPGGQSLGGSVIKYTIYHWNEGQGSALNPIITDVITGAVIFEQSQNPGWFKASEGVNANGVPYKVLTYSVPSLPNPYPASQYGLYAELYVRNDYVYFEDDGKIITNTVSFYSPDQPGGFASTPPNETNTVTHTTFVCTDSLTIWPDLEITNWEYGLFPNRNGCVFTDTHLVFTVTVRNNSPVTPALATYSPPYYHGFSTELHAVHELSPAVVITPAIHYFGYCPDNNSGSTCNTTELGGRDSYYENTPDDVVYHGGLPPGGSATLVIVPEVASTLPLTGWWYIHVHPDKYWGDLAPSPKKNPNWGFIQEGTAATNFCWERNNVRTFSIRVLPYGEIFTAQCGFQGGGGGGGSGTIYLPTILKNRH